MSSPLSPKNNYIISKRNYLDDYYNETKKDIDMSISGKFITPFPKLAIPVTFDEYVTNEEITKLSNLIKEKYHLNKEIIIGPGANGLIQNLLKVLMYRGGNLVTPFYTFNEAEYACSSFDGFTKRVFCKNYRIDFAGLLNAIDQDTKCIYICNPNNPTGIYESLDKIIELSKHVQIPLIVDESCIEFTKKESLLEREIPDNIIVLRSFSKAYGLANLRIGYMVCNKEFKKRYLEKITINEVSSIAIYSAIAMLNSTSVSKNITKVIEERERIKKELLKNKIECLDSDSNILFTKNSFNLPSNISLVKVKDEENELHYRIAIQDEKTNDLFIKELNK